MNPFDLFNKGQNEKKRNDLRNALFQIGSLGGAGYAASKLLDGADLKSSVAKIKNSSTDSRELGVAGQKIRQELDILQENLAKNSADKIRSSIMEDSRLDEILGANGDLSSRRAMLASLFDSYKMELGDIFDEGLADRIKVAYEEDEGLSANDLKQVKNFYNTTLRNDDDALARFNSRYKRLSGVGELLDSGMLVANQNIGPRKINTRDIGSKSLGANETFVRNSFKSIQDKFGSNNVSLIERKVGNLGNIIEAEISFGQRTLNVPLNTVQSTFNTPIYSGTSSGATLYTGPMAILDAVDLKKNNFQKVGGKVPGMKRFEEVVLDELFRGFNSVGRNFSDQNINNFYSFMRSLGTDLPRSTLEGQGRPSLLTSKAMEGSSVFIRNVDESGLKSNQVVNFLLKNMGDTFGGAGAQQNVTTSLEDPFDRNKKINLSQVQLMTNKGEATLNPLSQIMGYGRDVDRALLPQTAREQQMIGRGEYLFSGRGLDANSRIGRKNNIKVFGSNKELVGIKPTKGATIRGANLGMFMVIGDKSSELGLSEGSAYSGGKFSVNTNITKTVTQHGVEKFKLMTLLEELEQKNTELKVGKEKTDLNRGYYNIDDFFNNFGKRGEAILGYRDSGFSVIKRHKGMSEFSLKISGRSSSGGREKVHLSGSGIKGLENMKLFSAGFKGTLEYAEESSLDTRLENMGFGEQFRSFSSVSDYKSSVITDESMIKKSAQYLGMQIFGGFKLFGGDEDNFIKSMTSKIGADDVYLDSIRSLAAGKQVKDLSTAPVESRQAGFLKAMIETVLETRPKGTISDQEVGMILGGVQKLGTRFGMEQQEIDDLIKQKGSANILAESKKGVAAGAMYATSGDVYTDLGRNLARVEPRFANYLYQSLRSNFGFAEDEATEYISSIVAKQEGAAEKAQAALGMKLSAFSMSEMSGLDVRKNLEGLTDLKNLSKEEIEKLFDLSGNEREMSEELSKSKSGNILETNKLGLNKKAQLALEKSLGGKTSFMLPGGDTYEGLKGHIIRSQGEDVNIANEYLRYTNDLVGSLSSLKFADEDDTKIQSAIRGFETSKKLLATTTANTIRNTLSGKVLGSGTYRGRGISLGKGGQGNIGGKIMSQNETKLMSKIFDKTAGYAIVADTQAFMDGMSTFKEAARRDMMRSSGKTNVKKEVNELMGRTLRNFFLGIYETEPAGVVVDSQRNPLIGMGNIFANIEMFRKEGADSSDEFFNKYLIGNVKKRYEKNDATKSTRGNFFQKEKQNLQDKIKKANSKRELDSLKDLAGDGKYKKALAYKQNNLEDFLNSRNVIDIEAKRLGFKGKDSRKNFFKFVKGFMGDEPLGDLGHKAGGKGDGSGTQLGEAYLQVQKERGHQVLKDKYKDPNDRLRKAIANYKYDEYKEYTNTMTQLRSTDAYKSRKSDVSAVYDEINRNVNNRMVSENIFETSGTLKGNQMFQNLEKMEELYMQHGRASKEFKNREVGKRFTSFEELFEAEQALIGTKEEKEYMSRQSSVLRSMQESFIREAPQGGGTVSFFDVKIKKAELIGQDGSVVGSYSGRADINRAGIGDFDGDIYQIFFRTDEKSVRNKRVGVEPPKQMFNQSMSMGIMMDQLSAGMKNLGKRMGASDMDLIASQISEKEKERILKGVGGVDIEVKTLMMGMAQAASDSGDKAEYFKSMKGGMALLASMQEILVIQAKKLPMASNVPEAFTAAMRSGFKTGSGEKLKKFLSENILSGTELMQHRKLKVGNIEFGNIDGNSTGGAKFKAGIGGTLLDIDEIFATIDRGFAAVKSYGLNKMPSTSRLSKELHSGRVADLRMLSNLLSSSMTMEGGVMGGANIDESMSEINRIMSGVELGAGEIRSTFAQKAGALGVAAGLVASGAIGSMMSGGEINPEGVFSDMRVRENMSMRSMQENMGREHGNVSPQSIGGPGDNFYERPILSGETSVISNVSTRFYGEAPSVSNGTSMARQFVSAGGQAAMHINDRRMPISNSYITKSIRD